MRIDYDYNYNKYILIFKKKRILNNFKSHKQYTQKKKITQTLSTFQNLNLSIPVLALNIMQVPNIVIKLGV